MSSIGTKWISRSLFVLLIATGLFWFGRLQSWEWLTVAGAYLGYNLFSSFSDKIQPKG